MAERGLASGKVHARRALDDEWIAILEWIARERVRSARRDVLPSQRWLSAATTLASSPRRVRRVFRINGAEF